MPKVPVPGMMQDAWQLLREGNESGAFVVSLKERVGGGHFKVKALAERLGDRPEKVLFSRTVGRLTYAAARHAWWKRHMPRSRPS